MPPQPSVCAARAARSRRAASGSRTAVRAQVPLPGGRGPEGAGVASPPPGRAFEQDKRIINDSTDRILCRLRRILEPQTWLDAVCCSVQAAAERDLANCQTENKSLKDRYDIPQTLNPKP